MKAMTVCENFRLVPQFDPKLQNHINNIEWDYVQQTLKMTVEETTDFAAYAWFSTINVRQTETQNDAFADLEKDAILLVFMDNENQEIGKFKFLNNTLLAHNLYAHRKQVIAGAKSQTIDQPFTSPASHSITIGYKQVLKIDLDKK